MTTNNHDSRQRFAAIKKAVSKVPNDPSTGTGWLKELPVFAKDEKREAEAFAAKVKERHG